MELSEILAILQAVRDSEITEFGLVKGDFRLRIRQAGPEQVVIAQPEPLVRATAPTPLAAAAAPAPQPAAPVASPPVGEKKAGLTINSPMVGTFYRAASPEAAPFVEVGDVVKLGQVVCIIEAMKLMNEFEAEAQGRVVRLMVENGEAVEYGQPLFELEPV